MPQSETCCVWRGPARWPKRQRMTERILLDAPGLALGDVSLSPVAASDREGLRAAANSEETWRWYTFRADGPKFDAQFWPGYFETFDRDKEIHFVVRYEGEIVGSTCFLAIDDHHKRLEIGGTWYQERVRGGIVNPSCKRLLIQRAFDWGAQRVELKTDSNNARSRAAILKLGCQYEGTLRNHMYLHNGRVRHTAYFSILPEEWPAARDSLDARIAALS